MSGTGEGWDDFLKKHKQIPPSWKYEPTITITAGNESLDLLIEWLQENEIPKDGFRIKFSVIDQLVTSPKILAILQAIENHDRYYSLELSAPDVMECNDRTKSFFKMLRSNKCKINSFTTDVYISSTTAKSMFSKFLKKNTTITDLNLTTDEHAQIKTMEQSIKWLAGIKKNKTIQRLKLSGIENESVISEILAANHTITSIDLSGRNLNSDDILLGLATMGSLKSIKLDSVEAPKSVGSISEAIKGNKNLKKFYLFDNREEFNLSTDETKLLAMTLMAHPALQQLSLPGLSHGVSMCPLIKAICDSTAITALEVPVKQIMVDEELQKSILSMKSLRKLIFAARGNQGSVSELDLSNLVHSASPIQTLVFCSRCRYNPTDSFINTLENNTSVQLIKLKKSVAYWPRIARPTRANPFVEVRFATNFFHQHDDERFDILTPRMILIRAFKQVINCLNILRTIYLPADRGIFATIPNEILVLIWKSAFHNPGAFFQFVNDDRHLKKLVQIASDRSKLGRDPDARKRLQLLWLEDDIRSICLRK